MTLSLHSKSFSLTKTQCAKFHSWKRFSLFCDFCKFCGSTFYVTPHTPPTPLQFHCTVAEVNIYSLNYHHSWQYSQSSPRNGALLFLCFMLFCISVSSSLVFNLEVGKAGDCSEYHLWQVWEDSCLQPQEVQSVWWDEWGEHDRTFIQVRFSTTESSSKVDLLISVSCTACSRQYQGKNKTLSCFIFIWRVCLCLHFLPSQHDLQFNATSLWPNKQNP